METYECLGIKTKRNLNTMRQSVDAMIVLGDAVADAVAHSGSATGVMLRIHTQQRKTAVLAAIKYELTNRMNDRIAHGKPLAHDHPRLPLPYLENSIQHARQHAVRAMEEAL